MKNRAEKSSKKWWQKCVEFDRFLKKSDNKIRKMSTFSGTLSNISGMCQHIQYNKRQQYQKKSKKMSTKIRKIQRV